MFNFWFDRQKIYNFDWLSFSITTILLSIGLAFVYSTTCKDAATFSIFFKKQLFGAGVGLIIYLIFCSIDLYRICRWGYFGYAIILLLLMYTITSGWIGMGAKRWISLYFLTFQPSELVKLALPLAFAFYFYEKKISPSQEFIKPKLRTFQKPLIVLFITFLLILKQPDLGTALIILFSGFLLLWILQIPKIFFITLGFAVLISTPIAWNILKPYQKQRILVLIGQGDAKKERYQIEQSKIAIGSGRLLGKGFTKGTQNRLAFLPESRTDFIFSVLCEEWGFLGAMLILILFAILFIRQTQILLQLSGFLEQIVGIGLLAPIMFSTVINLGMVTSLLPIVGIPLPLFTYGITHLWTTLASLGILNNIAIRRNL